MRIAFTRWRSGGLLSRPSPRKRLLPKKKTSSGFEFVSGLAAGASAMPAKWSRRVFSFTFYEGKISAPGTLTSCAFRKSAANVRVMAMQPDDMLVQQAALALAHLMTASDDQEMNNLDRETIRTCAATAAGERDFRRLVVDCAQSWATTVENGIERMAERHEIELALRSVLDD